MMISKFIKKYNENEDNNFHSENVVLLAKHVGSKEDLKAAKRILKAHLKNGSMTHELYVQRNEIHNRLWPLIEIWLD